jgi:hypothetical protein
MVDKAWCDARTYGRDLIETREFACTQATADGYAPEWWALPDLPV